MFNIRSIVLLTIGLLLSLPSLPRPANAQESDGLTAEVLEFVKKGDLRDGVEHLEKQLKAENSFKPADIQRCYQLVVTAFLRIRNDREAYAHCKSLLQYQNENIDNETIVSGMTTTCLWLVTIAARMNESNQQEALELVEKAIEPLHATADYTSTESPLPQVTQMRAGYAQSCFRFGKKETARAISNEEYNKLKRLFKDDPDNEIAAAIFLRSISTYMRFTDDEAALQSLYVEHQGILDERMEQDPENVSYTLQFISALTYKTNWLLTNNPTEARELAEEGMAMLKDVAEAYPALRPRIQNQAINLTRLKSTAIARITAASLNEQSAIPFDATAWINGEETGLDELKGKVVLLNFWSMLSAPSQKTFPEIRRLHEAYSEHGLEIVGVTSYYNAGFDEKTKRPIRPARGQGIAEDEQETALQAFMEHHKLPYRSMVLQLDSKMNEQYGALGIPYMVLIDREGVIRSIKMGSDDDNFKQLEDSIQKLLKK